MKRRKLIVLAGTTVAAGILHPLWRSAMQLNESNTLVSSVKMPVLFVGHGSPMNAIADNDYTRTLARLGANLPRPKAILCISAHWMTKGAMLTHMPRPKTIHDFYGFPEELFSIQYDAPGSPEFAELVAKEVQDLNIQLDDKDWGLDHGTWSILKHIYPRADIPVFQLSLDVSQPAEYHYQLGQRLRFLREQGVLIVGSGNVVHNLRALNWNENSSADPRAIEFDLWVKNKIENKDFDSLVKDFIKSESGKFSVPSPDHYFPLLYVLGATVAGDEVKNIYEGIQNSSISMRSVLFTKVS